MFSSNWFRKWSISKSWSKPCQALPQYRAKINPALLLSIVFCVNRHISSLVGRVVVHIIILVHIQWLQFCLSFGKAAAGADKQPWQAMAGAFHVPHAEPPQWNTLKFPSCSISVMHQNAIAGTIQLKCKMYRVQRTHIHPFLRLIDNQCTHTLDVIRKKKCQMFN